MLIYIAVIVGLSLFHCVDSAKILVLPFPYYSHARQFKFIAEELSTRGHEIHIVLPPSMPGIQELRDDAAVTVIEYHMKYDDVFQNKKVMEQILIEATTKDPLQAIRDYPPIVMSLCLNPLEDEELMRKLEKGNYQLALMDGLLMSQCLYTIPYRLEIPYVSLTTVYDAWVVKGPALPSFVPFGMTSVPYTTNMNFFERINNLLKLVEYNLLNVPFDDGNLIAKYAPDKPLVSFNYLLGKSLLWLSDTDVAIDYPRPMMANEVNIGGLSTGPAKQLTGNVKTFVGGAENGLILVSFGSTPAITIKHFAVILDALGKVKQRVIVRYVHDPPKDIPKHILLQKWVPQNDVLGHPNTKLFLSHSGCNSQFEALYHGVPIINIPVFGDQPYNAKRTEWKGFSRTLFLKNLTADDILMNINEVLTNPSYRENIKRASSIFRSNPQHPKQRAADWIEQVMKYGGEHLHSYAHEMNWYEFLMLDILAFVLFISISALLVFYVLGKGIIQYCFKSNGKVKIS